MTITMSKRDYDFMKEDIEAIRNGSMCKILRIHHPPTQTDRYLICSDTTAGWTCPAGRAFHGTACDVVSETIETGLGTFFLINDVEIDNGAHVMQFTDDLNPDLP